MLTRGKARSLAAAPGMASAVRSASATLQPPAAAPETASAGGERVILRPDPPASEPVGRCHPQEDDRSSVGHHIAARKRLAEAKYAVCVAEYEATQAKLRCELAELELQDVEARSVSGASLRSAVDRTASWVVEQRKLKASAEQQQPITKPQEKPQDHVSHPPIMNGRPPLLPQAETVVTASQPYCGETSNGAPGAANVDDKSKWCDYACSHSSNNTPSLQLLGAFLEREAANQVFLGASTSTPLAAARPQPDRPRGNVQQPAGNQQRPSYGAPAVRTMQTTLVACLYCSEAHSIKMCPRFVALSPSTRLEWVRQSKICIKCLRKNRHPWRACKGRCTADSCDGPHHVLLHGADFSVAQNFTQNNGKTNFQNVNNMTFDPSSVKHVSMPDTSDTTLTEKEFSSNHEVLVQPGSKESEHKAVQLNSFSCSDTVGADSGRILLKVVPVIISGPKSSVSTFALLDDGSTATLIDADLADQIGAVGPKQLVQINGINTSREGVGTSRVNFLIRGKHSMTSHSVQGAYSLANLKLAHQSIGSEEISSYAHLDAIREGLCYQNATPKVLIGLSDWALLCAKESRVGSPSQPAATRTELGWVLYGPINKNTRTVQFRPPENIAQLRVSHCSLSTKQIDMAFDKKLDETLDFYYRLESMGIANSAPHNPSEKRALKILGETTRRLPSGRFESGLLWREDAAFIPDSYNQALSRLIGLERKFKKDLEYAKLYKLNIEAYVEKGYAELCPDTHEVSPAGKRWYLPHFGVTNPNKPGKLRIVHDAASKTAGVSLNSLLLPGPDLLQSLYAILLRFREGEVAMSGDIREMFPQVKIRESDRDCQRYLWWVDGRVREFRMSSLIFGAASSPCTAIYVKNKNADDFVKEFPDAVSAVHKDHYMDDFLGSVDGVENAARLAADIVYVHAQASFEMRAWVANKPEALSLVPKELWAEPQGVSLNPNKDVRVLGLYWNPVSDSFSFRLDQERGIIDKPLTKRIVLRDLMKVFDPLGFLLPIISRGKVLFQNTWRLVSGWDEPLPKDERVAWESWYRELASIGSLSIPRWYRYQNFDTQPLIRELHIFVDASNRAFACAAYWRFVFSGGLITTCFITGKSRVCPLKPVSVPRLELQAALLGARLARTLCKEIRYPVSKRFFWSDSKTTLAWIQSDARSFKPFVAHRVGEISELTKANEWRWVPTELNVADDATRVNAGGLNSLSRWLKGPDFLCKPEPEWPVSSNLESKSVDEITRSEMPKHLVNHFSVDVSLTNVVADASRFSSWYKLLRATARAHMFLRLLRQGRDTRAPRHLIASDFVNAETHLWRESQRESFPNDISSIGQGAPLSPQSKIKNLDCYLDSSGLLRLRSRTTAAPRIAESGNLIILEGHNRTVRLRVHALHEWANHGANETVVNELRRQYWIIRVRPTVRSIAKSCQVCRLRRARATIPPTGDLPAERLEHHHRPFTFTGLDYFGPLTVTIGRRHESRYVALFTCLVCRAVHLEIVGSLSADSAIMALRRFMARRGSPDKIFSDNGTAFVGANNELRREWESITPALRDFTASKRIEWNFIPPSSPFMGGAWERLVGTVKRSLASALRERAPREEVLSTVLTEVEHIVNSRPLTHVPTSTDDNVALTPNHFLLGSPSGLAQHETCEADLYRRADWKKGLRIADHFWERWVREYLPLLAPRRPTASIENLRPGDIVLIADSNLPRGVWPRGTICAVFPGRDGIVRVVDVQTRAGVLRRPVKKIVKVPVDAVPI